VNLGLDEQNDHLFRLFEEPLAELGCVAGPAGMAAAPRWTLLPASFDVVGDRADASLARFREPAAPARPLPADWWPDDVAPLVYCTFGSVAASMPLFPDFYRRVVDELAENPIRVLLTVGAEADPAALGALPSSVHVERYWPQRDVLPHASVVIGHGGFGTTLGALVAGLPQVAVPLFSFDQFENARRLAEVGIGVALLDDPSTRPVAGVVLHHGPAAAAGIGSAVAHLLADRVVQERAAELANEVAALPPVADCLAEVSELRPGARTVIPTVGSA
jgi:MGT family glycosyltransferase